MTHYKPAEGITQEEIDAFRAECREEGKRIDPLNCAVLRLHVHVLDPYGVYDLPPEAQCIGADWFVRNLPDGGWVWEHDIPKDIIEAVRARELKSVA